MKIIIILLGLGLAFAFIPTLLDTVFEANILDTIFEDHIVKTLLFYAGLIILIGGLDGVIDWLEDIVLNNQDDVKAFVTQHSQTRIKSGFIKGLGP